MGWGDWEGLTADEIEKTSPDLWNQFLTRGHEGGDEADWEATTAVPNGETLSEAAARMSGALAEILHRHPADSERVFVVGHGGSLRLIFAEALASLDEYRQFTAALGDKIPVLANITEFGQTPLFTREELAAAGVDMILYCCAAYRAMNAAALRVYECIRVEGTQQSVVPLMQTRADLYLFLDYHAYEEKLDRLFARNRREE